MDYKTEWTCTDSDNEQYGRQIDVNVFEFKEKNRGLFDYEPDEFIEITINLDDYDEKEIQENISSYYRSIEEMKEIYDDEWLWVVAECIFEQESGLY